MDNSTTTTSFSAGYTGQNPVGPQSPEDFGRYSPSFGEPVSKDKKFSEEENLVRQRARKAGRIYRQVCEDFQLGACFFSNFGEWTEYVEGRMSDEEFHGRTVTLAQTMMAAFN